MKEQPEALRLADIVERLNVGVHSQAIAEEYSAAARELRRLHERDAKANAQIKELLQIIEDFEHHTELLWQRVNELEEQLSSAQQGVHKPMAAVKDSLTPVNHQLTDHLCIQERLRALLESAVFARDIAMKMTMKADIPYCAEFSAIAQELDAAIANTTIPVRSTSGDFYE